MTKPVCMTALVVSVRLCEVVPDPEGVLGEDLAVVVVVNWARGATVGVVVVVVVVLVLVCVVHVCRLPTLSRFKGILEKCHKGVSICDVSKILGFFFTVPLSAFDCVCPLLTYFVMCTFCLTR